MPLRHVIRHSHIQNAIHVSENTMDALAACDARADRIRLHIGAKHPPFHDRFAVSQEHRRHPQSNGFGRPQRYRGGLAVPDHEGSTMGLFTKDIKTMDDLFVHQLQDIYYAEKQLVKALPKMADKATDPMLRQGFLTHLDETKGHVKRLEQVFQMHGAEVKAVDCPAIDGIIEEADEVTGEVADKAVLDAALINAGLVVRF
jgi:hypothetical protein